MNIIHSFKSTIFWLSILGFLFLHAEGFSQSEQTNPAVPLWTTKWNNSEATFEEIQRDFNAHWKGREHENKKGTGYKQYKRWETHMKPRIYPSGDMTLPYTNYHNYMDWKQVQPASSRSASVAKDRIRPQLQTQW